MDLKLKMPLLAGLTLMALALPQASYAVASQRMVGSLGAPSEPAKIKSFREWKSDRVQEALNRVTAARTQLEILKSKDPNLTHQKGALESASGLAMDRQVAQLENDESVLEMARNLRVTDYLRMVQNKKAAFNEVAGKLTADEIAELMSAYASSAFGNGGSELAPSANSAAEDKVR